MTLSSLTIGPVTDPYPLTPEFSPALYTGYSVTVESPGIGQAYYPIRYETSDPSTTVVCSLESSTPDNLQYSTIQAGSIRVSGSGTYTGTLKITLTKGAEKAVYAVAVTARPDA